jgi:arabinan endo-1,5-alpha-L-arabinosidase
MNRQRLTSLLIAGFSASLAGAQVLIDTGVEYMIANKNSGLVLSVEADSRTAGAAAVQTNNGGASQPWHFMPAGNNQYKILNLNSGELLGVKNASKVSGALLLQWADNGTADHLWQLLDAGDGYIKIKSVNSGLLAAVDGGSASPGAAVVQLPGNGDASQLWKFLTAGPAYPDPQLVTGDAGVHDPSLLKTTAGNYYLFGTHGGILMSASPDRVHFTAAGQAFATIPAWTAHYSPARDLWAPDVSYHDGTYWMYYAASGFGSNVSAIGVATSTDASPGSWSDLGIVYSSDANSPYNAIDPGLIVDSSGNWWLSLGSWSDGINLIQIDPATGKQAAWNQTRYLLAQRPADPAIEGSYISLHGNYYYLFASFDLCCRGVDSTYHIAVGRSASVTGPYVDRAGIDMTLGGGTILLSTRGRMIGPGGQVVMHDADGDLLIYHYYDSYTNGAPLLGINWIGWDFEQWPYLCPTGLDRGLTRSLCASGNRRPRPPRR